MHKLTALAMIATAISTPTFDRGKPHPVLVGCAVVRKAHRAPALIQINYSHRWRLVACVVAEQTSKGNWTEYGIQR